MPCPFRIAVTVILLVIAAVTAAFPFPKVRSSNRAIAPSTHLPPTIQERWPHLLSPRRVQGRPEWLSSAIPDWGVTLGPWTRRIISFTSISLLVLLHLDIARRMMFDSASETVA